MFHNLLQQTERLTNAPQSFHLHLDIHHQPIVLGARS
jgi:hypothetical protein